MAVLPCSWQALPVAAVSTMLELSDSRAAVFKDCEFCDSPDFCLGIVGNELGSQLCPAPYWDPFPSAVCCSETSSIPHRNGLWAHRLHLYSESTGIRSCVLGIYSFYFMSIKYDCY